MKTHGRANERLGQVRVYLFYLLCWSLCMGCGSSASRGSKVGGVGERQTQTPVAFEFSDLEGQIWRSVDQRGKPLVVTVFASWCQPCLGILQQLDATRSLPSYADTFDVVAVSVDQNLDPVLEAYLAQLGVQFPVLIADAKMRHGHGPFGRVVAVPTTYVLDEDGRLVDTIVGGAPVDHIVRRAMKTEGEK